MAKPIVQPNGGLCREGNTNPWLGQNEGKLTCLIPFGGAALSLSSPLEVRDLEVALKQMKLCPCYHTNFNMCALFKKKTASLSLTLSICPESNGFFF